MTAPVQAPAIEAVGVGDVGADEHDITDRASNSPSATRTMRFLPLISKKKKAR